MADMTEELRLAFATAYEAVQAATWTTDATAHLVSRGASERARAMADLAAEHAREADAATRALGHAIWGAFGQEIVFEVEQEPMT